MVWEKDGNLSDNYLSRLKICFTFACVAIMKMKYPRLLQISQKSIIEEMS